MQHHGDLALGLFAGHDTENVLLGDGLRRRFGVLALFGNDVKVVAGSQQGLEVLVRFHGVLDIIQLGEVLQGVLQGLGKLRIRRENDGALRCVGRVGGFVGIVLIPAAAETACQHTDGHGSRQKRGQ